MGQARYGTGLKLEIMYTAQLDGQNSLLYNITILQTHITNTDLEFNLHAGDSMLPGIIIDIQSSEVLNVNIQTVGRNFGVARLYRIKQSFVNEDVLVLGLDHVVALGSETRNVTVNV